MAKKWRALISSSKKQESIVDIPTCISLISWTMEVLLRELAASESVNLLMGNTKRDIMSLLENRLTDEELHAQMCAIITAGHETTAAWTLLERSSQGRYAWRNGSTPVSVHGEAEFSGSEFDLMPYLAAIVKPQPQEALRFHSAVFNVFKQAECDDIIPLSNPIITASGKVLRDRPIPKGPKIIASIASYNRFTFAGGIRGCIGWRVSWSFASIQHNWI
ncbi:hypothetical protein ARMSODRAFT_1001117 [Armillaria solidipes]|uniref:Cytochrome P450 n=1 Tax=Armillaria solidipes TaxID=1076256 RepID=A0A2H3C4J3_9AGAR|nr:hypothetical protein ARMSODRAFT_1001117 [Armillaria solidipes]